MRVVNAVLPADVGVQDGLAYALWLPPQGVEIRGGVVILHGAGSCKESHFDYARALLPVGFAALCFDARGHGESPGALDGRALEDIAQMADLLRERAGGADGLPLALRGSSLGGYLALIAAGQVGAEAVVAICPAGADGLRRGLARGKFDFKADVPTLDEFLADHDLLSAAEGLDAPVLLLHAEGDEQVPVQQSRELRAHLHHPRSRLIVVPGGHHRSIQHDGELQAVSLSFLSRTLTLLIMLGMLGALLGLAGCGGSTPSGWRDLRSVSVTVTRPGLPPPGGGSHTTSFTSRPAVEKVTADLNVFHIHRVSSGTSNPGCAGGAAVRLLITPVAGSSTKLSASICGGQVNGDLGGDLPAFLTEVGVPAGL